MIFKTVLIFFMKSIKKKPFWILRKFCNPVYTNCSPATKKKQKREKLQDLPGEIPTSSPNQRHRYPLLRGTVAPGSNAHIAIARFPGPGKIKLKSSTNSSLPKISEAAQRLLRFLWLPPTLQFSSTFLSLLWSVSYFLVPLNLFLLSNRVSLLCFGIINTI